jgi:DNA-3-methyladenine glycosylase II
MVAPVLMFRRITDLAALERATGELIRMDRRFGPICEATGPLPLRQKPAGFATILDAVVGQQVSVASAAAIWGRLSKAGLTTETAVAGCSNAALLACGLSRPKARYAAEIAQAGFNWAALADMTDRDACKALCQLPGVGRWTAEIYLLGAMGRADVLPAGDLALQEAARHAFGLPERPKEAELRIMAEGWSPLRAVAARALWAYYRVIKSREGLR